MSADSLNRIESWLVQAGLAGASETQSLHGFCDCCRNAGIALSRATLLVDTLHPIHEGRAFRWQADSVEQPTVVEYGPSNVGESAANWQGSPFYRLVETGASELRRRIGAGDAEDFAILRDPSRNEGGRANGLHRFRSSLRCDQHHRRDGMRLLFLDHVEP
jgi:adenylate cyclase